MTPQQTQDQWDLFISKHGDSHLLQTPAWGELKARYGWDVERILVEDSGAQILFRKLPLGFCLGYIPKGPIGPLKPQLISALDERCHERKAIFLKVEPDENDNHENKTQLVENGFIQSMQTIQPQRTLVIHLEGDDDALLSQMRQKTRYNVRLAIRKDVTVRPWEDFKTFGQMMQETALRDSFGVHTSTYYSDAFDLFHSRGACELFVAEYQGIPLAALMVFAQGSRAWYFYGASTNLERNRMPTYLLQWEAMKWARNQGCTTFDLWGVPDHDLETLEQHFTHKKGGLWGVYRFKRGFGGKLVRSIGAWDRVYKHSLYQLYRLMISLRRT